MAIIPGTTIEYELQNPAEVTSAYSYAKYINCWNKYELGVNDNPVIQWVSPNERINVTTGDSSNYIDIIWIYDEFNAYTDASVLIQAASVSQLPVITKLDIQTYKLVIDDITVNKATPTGNAFDTHTEPTSYNLQANENVRSMSYYFTERETVENPSILDKIKPVLRVNIDGETWYFLPPLFKELYIRNIPNSGNKLDATNPYGTFQPHSETDTLMFNPTGTTFAVTFPSLGHSFYCGGDDDYSIVFDNPANTTNLLRTEAATIDVLLRTIACMGCYFEFNGTVYLGFMDESGQTTGEYLTEEDWEKSSQWNSDNINNFTEHNPPYVPPEPVGDNIDDMNMNSLWAMSSDAGFARYFLMSHNQLASLMTWLSETTFPDGYDPYAYILSLLQFPLKLSPSWCMPRTPAGHIVIGGEDTGITASLIANEKAWVGAGTYDVPELNGNFLDYDPYTQYELYIPCCGWVSLPDIVCGRKIAVKINYDLTTAAIIGNVYVEIDGKQMIVSSKSGMMGRETVVTGEAQGVRSAQITSALLSAGTGALNVATGAMSGNAVAAVSGGYNIVAGLAQANIAANSAYTRTIGSTGGRALLCQFDQCYLKICTTRADIPLNYGHTCGYVCNISGKVSDFTGYTVFDNVDVSGIGKATDREKKLIKQILESGVIINPSEE